MKKVIVIKDEYIDNSVRVSIFEKNSSVKKRVFKAEQELNSETNELETVVKQVEVDIVKDRLLFCERLVWNNDEKELDNTIKELKREWELKINS